MTSALAAWRTIRIGTPVLVRGANGTTIAARTESRPFEALGGLPIIRVGGQYVALDRVHLAAHVPCGDCRDMQRCLQAGHCIGTGESDAPRAVSIADAIQPAPSDAQLAFADRPTAIIVTAILFVLTLSACAVAQAFIQRAP